MPGNSMRFLPVPRTFVSISKESGAAGAGKEAASEHSDARSSTRGQPDRAAGHVGDYAFQVTSDPVHPLARHVFQRLANPDDPLVGYYAAVSALEMLVRPYQADPSVAAQVRTFLGNFPNFELVPTDLDVANRAAWVRAATGLAAPDALVVASSLAKGCDALISNDKTLISRFSRLLPKGNGVYLGNH